MCSALPWSIDYHVTVTSEHGKAPLPESNPPRCLAFSPDIYQIADSQPGHLRKGISIPALSDGLQKNVLPREINHTPLLNGTAEHMLTSTAIEIWWTNGSQADADLAVISPRSFSHTCSSGTGAWRPRHTRIGETEGTRMANQGETGSLRKERERVVEYRVIHMARSRQSVCALPSTSRRRITARRAEC